MAVLRLGGLAEAKLRDRTYQGPPFDPVASGVEAQGPHFGYAQGPMGVNKKSIESSDSMLDRFVKRQS